MIFEVGTAIGGFIGGPLLVSLGGCSLYLVCGDRYAPLTIVSFHHDGTSLSGTALTNSSHTLQDNRVVVFEPGKCPWQAALVDEATLQPGDETGFHINNYYSPCVTEDLMVLGQRAYQP